MSCNRLIVFEGLDGVGKTSIALKVAQQTGALYVKTPPPQFSENLRDYVDEIGNIEARYLFYLSGSLLVGNQITDFIQNNHVVCDRYVESTIATHRALGVRVQIDLSTLSYPKADAVVVIHVEETVRLQRLASRDYKSKSDEYFLDDVKRIRLLREYEEMGALTIDTTHLGIDAAAERVLSILVSLYPEDFPHL